MDYPQIDHAERESRRAAFLLAIGRHSRLTAAAGWHAGIEKDIRYDKGEWLLRAWSCHGWPLGYDAVDGWDDLTPNERTLVRSTAIQRGLDVDRLDDEVKQRLAELDDWQVALREEHLRSLEEFRASESSSFDDLVTMFEAADQEPYVPLPLDHPNNPENPDSIRFSKLMEAGEVVAAQAVLDQMQARLAEIRAAGEREW